jgi:uncharacterized protein YktA (UPF0223 family)
MTKQLPISVIKDENKLYGETVEFPILAHGEEYIVKVYPFFRPEKVRELVVDLATFGRNIKEGNIPYQDHEEGDVVAYFILRNFTDIKFTKSTKFKNIYEEYKTVINSDVLKKVFNMFPKESVAKVYERIEEVIEANEMFTRQIQFIKDRVNNMDLVHKDAILN